MSFRPDEIAAWQEADRIFQTLEELDPPSRDQALAELEIRPEVRRCLERLLEASDAAGVLDQGFKLTGAMESDALVGSHIGPWRLDEQIGRGGMAVVYRATRETETFQQDAALKLLPRGMAGLEQFQREQQVLAALEHPVIARFLDGGIEGDGTPWIAMERIDGQRIDAAASNLEPAEVVQLLLPVIDAVTYAHSQLVIHRDLKPGNLLVDSTGRARLLDFGIAKLLSDGQGDQATRLLTPEFAAPEQFTGAPVSAATDVHGLGAVLHALLCGDPPRQRDGTRRKPSRPIADQDLANIVEKALREGPGDRYPSADSLGADLRRWLRREPVEATPDSRRYRLGLWFRRHRAAAAAGAAILLLVIAGSGAIYWQALQTARHAEVVEGQNAVLSQLLASPQITARGRQVQVVDILADAAELIDSELPNPSEARAELLANLGNTMTQLGDGIAAAPLWRRAIADLESLNAAQPRQILRYRLGLARARIEAESYDLATRDLEELNRATETILAEDDELRAGIALSRYKAASSMGAEETAALLDELITVGQSVNWQNPSAHGAFKCVHLQGLIYTGRFEEATAIGDELRRWGEENLGVRHGHTLCGYASGVTALSRSGQLEMAEQVASQGLAIAREWLGQNDARYFHMAHARANILEELGRYDEAIALHQEQLTRVDQIPGLMQEQRIYPVIGLAVAYLDSGAYVEALPLQQDVVHHMMGSSGPEHPSTYMAQANLAEIQLFAGDVDAALGTARTAHDGLSARLGPDHPVTLFARSVLGGALAHAGDHQAAIGHLDGTPAAMAAAFGPEDINVVNAKAWLGLALSGTGELQGAGELLREVMDWRLEKLGPDHPRTQASQRVLDELTPGRSGSE
ncbi:MAG: protein kinase [Xanthomonadales bacterium]|nr:protein kinase [Xanthomonadales bacterium]